MTYQRDNTQAIIELNRALFNLSRPQPGDYRKNRQYNKDKLDDNEPCDVETAICRKQSHCLTLQKQMMSMDLRSRSVLRYHDVTAGWQFHGTWS